ncbi:MAG: Ppx/GppA family phosphatase [Alphaproteobacteria bacterium]|nr:MAG: Ppx/GppA family phosphatase [Alphaproteobacteria bacterium]
MSDPRPCCVPDAPPGPGTGPIAVVDIGSNSIRLVVYSGLERGALTLFNEKVLCGLGRGLAHSGRLHPDGVALARRNLVRFTRLAAAMGVARIDLLATAAVREAADGAAFVAEIEALCGHPVKVLSGAEEGRLSALGVIAGLDAVDGVMGDLGGGSLELVELRGGEVGARATLPLGPFQLMERCGDDFRAMANLVDARLDTVPWLESAACGCASFFAVGGAWRSLARIHMDAVGHPLRVIHGFAMCRREVDDLAAVIAGRSRRALARVKGVTRERLETLPAATVVLRRVLHRLRGPRTRFSALGLREGYLYDLLPAAERARDPLIAQCADIARREAHFDPMGEAVFAWSEVLFAGALGAALPPRLRRASCLLSDISWRDHPDYRAVEALFRILHYPFIGIDHAARVALGYSAYIRYGGAARGAVVAPYLPLMPGEVRRAARILGLAQRLAYRVSGATAAILARSRLVRATGGRELHLVLPDDGSAPVGAAVERDLHALAEAVDAAPVIAG